MNRNVLKFLLYGIVMMAAVSCGSNDYGGFDPDDPGKKPKPPAEPAEGTFVAWPEYSPTISYDFNDYVKYPMPDKNLEDDVTGRAYSVDDRWWTCHVGVNANNTLTRVGIDKMLQRLNDDFAYLRDEMGWPPDKNTMNGYRSSVYVYGSGMSTDNASNTDLGGWQGWVFTKGEYWPMVIISYYPIYCFDPSCDYPDKSYQTNAVVHEGIHAVQSSLPGCKKAGWFHEGGNNWLQRTLDFKRLGGNNYSNVSLGWLSAGSLIAPFMPIECYSGWLTDDSFGGPDGEGINNNTRSLLGGCQYSESFPTYMEVALGEKSIPWIWQNCPERVLEGISAGLGDAQTKRLVYEYRARMALTDMGGFSKAYQNMLNEYMGHTITPEAQGSSASNWKATPYTGGTVADDGTFTPYKATLPGWTGANVVPVKVKGGKVKVLFDAKGSNMVCQLCYRSKSGVTVYGEPFYDNQEFTMDMSTYTPANDVVFVVVTNLDYKYAGDQTRRKRYDYGLKFTEGFAGLADIHKKWFNWSAAP